MIRGMRLNTALVLAAAAFSGCAEQPPPLVGAWRSKVQFDSGAYAAVKDLEFMYAFNAGGTMTESSNYDAAPPVPPAYGTWRRVAPNEYETHYEYYATQSSDAIQFLKGAGWIPAGHGVLIEKVTLAGDGRTFASTLTFEVFDAHGKPATGGGTARGKAVRIGP
jgi:hypothetical protein